VETFIGIAIWVAIFLIWYIRTYPEKVKGLVPLHGIRLKWPARKRRSASVARKASSAYGDYKSLVEQVEVICSKEQFSSSDAAAMVEAVKHLMELEPGSGQIWEAYALDSLETATIKCDDCKIPVEKTVKKTGVKIYCKKCGKWLALKNSKVTVLDPSRPDVEDWEK
jgi:hypothetical protein